MQRQSGTYNVPQISMLVRVWIQNSEVPQFFLFSGLNLVTNFANQIMLKKHVIVECQSFYVDAHPTEVCTKLHYEIHLSSVLAFGQFQVNILSGNHFQFFRERKPWNPNQSKLYEMSCHTKYTKRHLGKKFRTVLPELASFYRYLV